LNCFLVRLLVESAYQIDTPAGPTLTDSADVLAERLRGHRPAVFDAAGNRGGGEFVVALLPRIDTAQGGAEVESSAVLEVWSREGAGRPTANWRLIRSLLTDHARRPESAP
jgi:hypothetical protein